MTKLFIIAGHGAGDPGACANGYQEAERVRVLAKRVKELGGSDVMLGDVNRNYYADGGINYLDISTEYKLLELHMDAASASARGGHVIINGNYSADEWDEALAAMISKILPGRSKTIVGRTDLANPSRAAARGYNYRLMECGFITNAEDVAIFNANIDTIAKGILAAFGIEGGESVMPVEPTPSQPATSDLESLGKVTVRYRAKVNGEWLEEVTDFNNYNGDGFAGLPCKGMSAVAIGVDKGSIKYKAHVKGGDWLPEVTGYDIHEHINGYAGDGQNVIDGIMIYYVTPDGYEYQQAYYRSQTVDREGWLDVVEDYNDYAGIYGEGMDRLQVCISDHNPF